jgi:antitoxin component of MazEF toxin-antitoxin module
LVIRIPRELAAEAALSEGDAVVVEVSARGELVLRPARRKYKLDELVSRITRKNRHAETDWGGAAGKEAW